MKLEMLGDIVFAARSTWLAFGVGLVALLATPAFAVPLTESSSASVSSTQYGASLLCVLGCPTSIVSQSSTFSPSATASQTTVYDTTGANHVDGTGSAFATTDLAAGTVGVYATGSSDSGTRGPITLPGYISSTATAAITGSLSFNVATPTLLPVLFQLVGNEQMMGLLGAPNITSQLTIWVGNPSGGLGCSGGGKGTCYNFTYTSNVITNVLNNLLKIDISSQISRDWAGGAIVTPTAGGGFGFDDSILLPDGNDVVTFVDQISATAGNGSVASFADTQLLGLDTSHNTQSVPTGGSPTFLSDPALVPEPSDFTVLALPLTVLFGLRRARPYVPGAGGNGGRPLGVAGGGAA